MSLHIEGRSIQRALVLGYGLTGRAVVNFLEKRCIHVAVSEQGQLGAEDRADLAARGVDVEDGGHTERLLVSSDTVIVSPGVPMNHPMVAAARRRGIPILSETDLAASQAPPSPVIAVTGTNGKGTTVMLIASILRQIGMRPCVGGNIGTPFVSLLEGAAERCDVFVLEASSYQLEQSRLLRPDVAVLLNFSPDHLARHGDMEIYAAAKGRLFGNQCTQDVAVLPAALAERFRQGAARRSFYDDPWPTLPAGSDSLAPHNRANLAAAVVAAGALVPDLDPATLSLDELGAAFSLPHRMEPVGELRGVRVIDDSKSTNADSTIAALRTIDGSVTLLLGGRHKGAGYDALAREIGRRQVRSVVVFGEAADDLAVWLGETGLETTRASTMEEAIDVALSVTSTGDTLLLSPGCSSLDAFASFDERGEAFAAVIRARDGFIPPPNKNA